MVGDFMKYFLLTVMFICSQSWGQALIHPKMEKILLQLKDSYELSKTPEEFLKFTETVDNSLFIELVKGSDLFTKKIKITNEGSKLILGNNSELTIDFAKYPETKTVKINNEDYKIQGNDFYSMSSGLLDRINSKKKKAMWDLFLIEDSYAQPGYAEIIKEKAKSAATTLLKPETWSSMGKNAIKGAGALGVIFLGLEAVYAGTSIYNNCVTSGEHTSSRAQCPSFLDWGRSTKLFNAFKQGGIKELKCAIKTKKPYMTSVTYMEGTKNVEKKLALNYDDKTDKVNKIKIESCEYNVKENKVESAITKNPVCSLKSGASFDEVFKPVPFKDLSECCEFIDCQLAVMKKAEQYKIEKEVTDPLYGNGAKPDDKTVAPQRSTQSE